MTATIQIVRSALLAYEYSSCGHAKTVWRFSLQDPSTGQRRGFATLEALLSSLQAILVDEHND